jgi:hypothetical protein
MIVAWALPARSLVVIQNQGRDNADEKHHKKKKGKDSGHLGRTRNQATELEEDGDATDYYKPCGVVKHEKIPSCRMQKRSERNVQWETSMAKAFAVPSS